jgi:DNA-binding CsgD family transcriptional regulator
LVQAQTVDELQCELVRRTRSAGFEYVSATILEDRSVGAEAPVCIHNTPAGRLEAFESPHNCRRDPAAQHCRRNSLPLVWDQKTYLSAGQANLWESQARFGYKTGIALALHMPAGRHFMFGVDRDQPLPSDEAELTALIADVHLLAVYANEAVSRVVLPPADRSSTKLAKRELDCLSWTMEGKTAWEVGAILGIAETTVVSYLRSATRKLGCINKQQAVARALRSGLLR